MNADDRFIVLLRHGIAEDKTAEKSDAQRALTDEGNRRMKKVAKALASRFEEAEAIYSSPLVRAMETAAWVAKAYGLEIRKTDALAPSASTADFRQLLDRVKERYALFVGHEPTLSEFMLDLTQMRADGGIELKKGGCYGIRMGGGKASLEWMMPPRFLR